MFVFNLPQMLHFDDFVQHLRYKHFHLRLDGCLNDRGSDALLSSV